MIIESQNLTPEARAALAATNFRAGSPLPHGTTLRVAAELASYGLIDADAVLTRDGAVVRARHIDETMKELEA